MSLQDKIKAGRAALRGGIVPVSAPDLFPTPPDVAARVAGYLVPFPGCRVLEPSAGTGALLRAIETAEPRAQLRAIERDYRLAESLAQSWSVDCLDFLTARAVPEFDRVAMNPPFSNGADILHVEHAARFLKPGGVLVAIVADGPRQARVFRDAEDLERLPSGTFAGTQVRARIIRIRANT